MESRRTAAGLVLALAVIMAPRASAQTVEFTPMGGYRFGGDFFELTTGEPVDVDGAPAIGGAIDVSMGAGLWFEALFTGQEARVVVPGSALAPQVSWRVRVDHLQVGGLQELDAGRVRPYLAGALGLTRYAGGDESEVRFTLGAGGGAKIALAPRLGLRLDTRVYATFIDADADAVACGPGLCLVGVHATVAWQVEFSAGIVMGF